MNINTRDNHIKKFSAKNSQDIAPEFDAFLSYSHVDRDFAAKLQHGLELIWHELPPRYRRKRLPLRIIRDETDFDATDDLAGYIRTRVRSSASLIIVGSPATRRSFWVNQVEIPTFLEKQENHQRIVVAVQHGDDIQNSIPESLTKNSIQPLAITLDDEVWRANPKRKRELIRLMARVIGEDVYTLLDRHGRYRRKVLMLRSAVLAITVTAFTFMGYIGWHNLKVSQANALAERSAELNDRNPRLSLQLARKSWQLSDNTTTYAALFRAGNRFPQNRQLASPLSGAITAMSFSPDGQLIVTTSDARAKVLNSKNDLLLTLTHATDSNSNTAITDVAAVKDSGWLTATNTGEVILWDKQGKPKRTLGLASAVNSIVVSANGQAVLVEADSMLAYWLPNKDKAFYLDNPQGFATSGFLAQSTQFLSVSRAGFISLMSNEGKLLRSAQTDSGIVQATISSDGRVVTQTYQGKVQIWDQGLEPLSEFSLGVQQPLKLALFQGKDLVIAGRDQWPFELYGYSGNPAQLKGKDTIYQQAFSRDNHWFIASNAGKDPLLWSEDIPAGISLGDHGSMVTALSFSQDGQLVATGTELGQLRVWQLDGLLQQRYRISRLFISSLVCRHDSDHCLIAGDDGTMVMWSQDKGFEDIPAPCHIRELSWGYGQKIAGCKNGEVISLAQQNKKITSHERPVRFVATQNKNIISLDYAGQLRINGNPADKGVNTVMVGQQTIWVTKDQRAYIAGIDQPLLTEKVLSWADATSQKIALTKSGLVEFNDKSSNPVSYCDHQVEDGATLISLGKGLVALNSTSSKYLIDTLNKHCIKLPTISSNISSAAYKDGRIWLGTENGWLHLLNREGIEFLALNAHAEEITHMTVARNYLITAGGDGVAIAWKIDPLLLMTE